MTEAQSSVPESNATRRSKGATTSRKTKCREEVVEAAEVKQDTQAKAEVKEDPLAQHRARQAQQRSH